MAFTTGMTVVFDAVQGVELVWGGATRVWNFFSRSEMQPAAAVYFANCAIYGGESEGWHASLCSYSTVCVHNGFTIGTGSNKLSIGYPGAETLHDLISAKYGTRWLGVLSVLATLPDVHTGADELSRFLTKTASDPTRAFVLGRDQCERLWTLSRELFCGSPYWYRLLEIVSICAIELDQPPKAGSRVRSVLDLVFPDRETYSLEDEASMRGQFFSAFMTAAYEIWQLSRKEESRGRNLWARGSSGCAQLIFYLSVVCGLHVRLAGRPNISFGDLTPGEPEVMIDIVPGMFIEPWKVGYVMDGGRIETTICELLPETRPGAKSQTTNVDWRASLAVDTPRSISSYRVGRVSPPLQAGQCLQKALNSVRREIRTYELESYVSQWFSNYVHGLIHFQLLRDGKWEHEKKDMPKTDESRQSRMAIKSERLLDALEVCAPDLIEARHLEQLIDEVRRGVQPNSTFELTGYIPRQKADKVCSCAEHGGPPYKTGRRCRISWIQWTLISTAEEVWVCSYIGTGARHYRDACIATWMDNTGIPFHIIQSPQYTVRYVEDIIRLICQRLGGLEVEERGRCIGRVAGGFAVGVIGNETVSIFDDPGHSIFIIPGRMVTPDRHVKQILYDFSTLYAPLLPTTFDLEDQMRSLTATDDLFRSVVLRHKLQVQGDLVYLSACLYIHERHMLRSNPLTAIDKSLDFTEIEGCLTDCVQRQHTRDRLWWEDPRRIALCLPQGTSCRKNSVGSAPSSTEMMDGVRNHTRVDPDAGSTELQDIDTVSDIENLVDRSQGLASVPLSEDAASSDGESEASSETYNELSVYPARNNVLVQRAVLATYPRVAVMRGDCVPCAIVQAQSEGMDALLC